MTSKEKAIKAFENVEKFISDLPMSVVGYNTPSTSEWVSDQLNIVEDHLNNPTLDDAIKVVENLKQSQKIVDWKQVNVRTYNVGINNEQFEDITNYEPIFDNQDLFDDILTALKGLKEGKE